MDVGGLMATMSSSFSDFPLEKNSLLKEIQDKLEILQLFSDRGFSFQAQDEIESTLATIKDCYERFLTCLELCKKLHILGTCNQHKNKNAIRLILSRYKSIRNLLKQSIEEVNNLDRRLEDCDSYLKKIQTDLIESRELICHKCEGVGRIFKNKYVRERGSSPQPFLQIFPCEYCNGSGKIVLNSGIKAELSKFIHHSNSLVEMFEKSKSRISNFLGEYKIPSLEGYNEIERIFPEDRLDVKAVQQQLSKYYETEEF